MKAMKTSHPVRGLTLRAVAASLLGMMLAGIYTQVSAVLLSESYFIPESAIPIPASGRSRSPPWRGSGPRTP